MGVHLPLPDLRRPRDRRSSYLPGEHARSSSTSPRSTSIHSFWAYELGVKADANPGVDNVAYVETKKPRTFHIRCAELCGLWHGYMFDEQGAWSSPAAFATWIKQQQVLYAPIVKDLPPYSTTYSPSRP